MTTFAADRDAELLRSEIERRTREAWASYRDTTRELDGAEYLAAEAKAWDALQRELHDAAR
jgi:hypothetical protein